MGKASRTKQEPDRRARIAAQREAERRAAQRKRIYLAGGSILVVVIVVIAFVLVKLNSNGTAGTSSNGPTGAALASVTKQVTDIPASVTDTVAGTGVPTSAFVAATTPTAMTALAKATGSYLATIDGTPLTESGKPEVLFLGSNYCPFCAAQRWAMVNAFSRFGTFTGLTTTHSSSSDEFPNTPTYTFYGSKYTSKYITFTSVELNQNYRVGNGTTGDYVTLQTPTQAEETVEGAYDPTGSIPFIDFGNKYAQVGNIAPLTPSLLAGKTWAQVAAAMNDPSSAIGQAEDANANYETAAICTLTKNLPATACTPAIQKLELNLAK